MHYKYYREEEAKREYFVFYSYLNLAEEYVEAIAWSVLVVSKLLLTCIISTRD